MSWTLLNNDFEYPVQSDTAFVDFSSLTPGASDWPTTSTGFAGISRGNVPTLNDGITPPSGSQDAYFYDNGFISQDVASVPAGTYTLSLYARKAGYGGGQNNIAFKVDGTLIDTFSVSSGSWTQYTSVPFTVSAGTRTTRFEGTSTSGGNVVLFDLITLTPASTATGSGAVTLGGLTVSGSAAFSTAASGSVTLGSLTPAGTGRLTASASGSIAAGGLAASGSATAGAAGPTTATLTGPTSGALNLASTSFTVTLDVVAGTGGVVVFPASTGGSDTFS